MSSEGTNPLHITIVIKILSFMVLHTFGILAYLAIIVNFLELLAYYFVYKSRQLLFLIIFHEHFYIIVVFVSVCFYSRMAV